MVSEGAVKIAISMGDPAGVGPEVIVKSLAAFVASGIEFLIIGSEYYLEQALRVTGGELDYSVVSQPEFNGRIALFEPAKWEGEYAGFGSWSKQTGGQSLMYVKLGAELCLNGTADALVTAPICKAAWKAAGCEFPGHTELLGELSGGHDEVMLLAGGGLRVGLVTIHEALADLPRLITRQKIIDTVKVIDKDLRERFAVMRPRFAVLGLNPHAGEEGHIGREEIDIINPAVHELSAIGIAVSEALPADTAFYRMLSGEFDVILAMYHDQGLGPLKTLAFDSGVNITMGLPLIRTSVDHGTAFGIAGSGKAVATSMLAAIECAANMVGNQRRYQG